MIRVENIQSYRIKTKTNHEEEKNPGQTREVEYREEQLK